MPGVRWKSETKPEGLSSFSDQEGRNACPRHIRTTTISFDGGARWDTNGGQQGQVSGVAVGAPDVRTRVGQERSGESQDKCSSSCFNARDLGLWKIVAVAPNESSSLGNRLINSVSQLLSINGSEKRRDLAT